MMFRRCVLPILLALCLSGCATSQPPAERPGRAFLFEQDTFAYANELVWEYSTDAESGRMTSRRREPPPDYTLHCFVVARAAHQFFHHAAFDPARPKVDRDQYRRLIRRLMARSPRRRPGENDRVIIPGYSHLREFSATHEKLLKDECGGAWESYFQRGHWRMILPFSRHHQERMAGRLKGRLDGGDPPVVHVVRFPSLKINHALLLFGYSESADEIRFHTYDPNAPAAPTVLRFDRAGRTFELPPNAYFSGGPLDVYDIYRGVLY